MKVRIYQRKETKMVKNLQRERRIKKNNICVIETQ